MLLKESFYLPGYGRGWIDDGHLRASYLADKGQDKWIMGTAEDEGIDAGRYHGIDGLV